MIYIFDASAMIAFLSGEAGADIVEQALLDTSNQCFAHAINLCEVFYDAHRKGGEANSIKVINDLYAVGIIERRDFNETFWQEVGRLKATHRASLADLCAVTLTNLIGGTLLTADHHEFDALDTLNICPIKFIR